MASSDAEEPKSANETPREASDQAAATGGAAAAGETLADPAQLYPPYSVKLLGLGETKVLTGTHFRTIEHSNPKLSVRLEHLETEFEDGPVLRITFEKKP